MKLSALAAAAVLGVGTAAGVAQAQEPVRWAALGDSYTAGLYVGTPEERPDGCDRTTNSYPHLVAERLGGAVTLANASCGAAEVEDVAETEQRPVSPVDAPDGGWPAVKAQWERAGVGPDTGVVTVGIGGNSMALGTIAFHCLLFGTGREDDATPCRDAYENGAALFGRESIRDKYDRVFREYVEMLERVQDRAPNAKVITVGYPTIFPEKADHCDRSDTTHFAATVTGVDDKLSMTRGDIEWLHSVVKELNTIIEDATDLVGYDYVDTSSPGHDVCQPDGVKWVEGTCGAARPFWPTELRLSEGLTLTCGNGTRATVVHPNAKGHRNTAAKVEKAVRDALA